MQRIKLLINREILHACGKDSLALMQFIANSFRITTCLKVKDSLPRKTLRICIKLREDIAK